MIRTAIEKSKKLIQEIKFQIKLKEMDYSWYIMGEHCFELFPPSFYYTHTQEEIERITAETFERLQEMIEQLE